MSERYMGSEVLAQILLKRQRQIAKGYTQEHDDEHVDGEIARAAIPYIQGAYAGEIGLTMDELTVFWPFEDAQPNLEQPRRELLLNAAALIVAEIERLDRRARPATYRLSLIRRLWEAQTGDLPDEAKRTMAEAAMELEGSPRPTRAE